ncbi:sigma-70 family RNA polymerase sigma factor [Streptomyces capillispiralis]|uniref:RNA polymerase sigma factor (Sigma-70 family) n=1 Tax=Streptomyces capillispiralis TaxID=68182 RepID=A0A561SG97_9ACTN|nr:sigma-70 family RNA polymerase sigma factor [Streptomyces capillispiralis]TWF73894.1 RNA polymerase sigma factor (sigma-70 family) [Streptomyces capillispiralis]GHE24180.1 hypothetical protein GCM10017779_71580 [Streptomyces capillispiralis]
MQQADLEQQTQAILRSHIIQRLQKDTGNPGVGFLEYIRSQLEIDSSNNDLYKAILELPEQQFTVIVLHYLLGYRTDEIARYLGMHPNSVRYRIRRSQLRLCVSLVPTAPAQAEKEERGSAAPAPAPFSEGSQAPGCQRRHTHHSNG